MITDGELANLREVTADAESCGRLSDWEEEFLDSLRSRILTIGERMHMSDAQWTAFRRIEEKVYRT